MTCCPNCFVDVEIQPIIKDLSRGNIGTCNCCYQKNVPIVDIEDLLDYFVPLFDLYEETDNPVADCLSTTIQKEWNIFANDDIAKSITNYLLIDYLDKSLKGEHVKEKFDGTSDSDKIWQDFVNEIKCTNRFFINNNAIVRDIVSKLLQKHTKTLKAGTSFFRARICDNINGFSNPASDLGKPPYQKTTSGRANPQGISYLYLASDPKTTLFEVRASFLDYVCIGEFELVEDIIIVSLNDIHNISPFIEDINLQEYVTNKTILNHFREALSKPLRKTDSDLEYLPTQYLCEYIKSSLKVHGVEYASAMHTGGINYAFFDDQKFQFKNAKTVEINKIDMEYASIKESNKG